MKNTTEAELLAAAAQLNRSERGRQAMKDLLALLDNGADALDFENQAAVATFLRAAWSNMPSGARETLREGLQTPARPQTKAHA
jgi:hypothetical protein